MTLTDLSKSSIKLVFGSAGAQVSLMLGMMFLTRLFSPEQFGEYQVYVSTGNILLMVSMLRYEMAIILPKYHSEAIKVLLLSLGLGVVVAALSFIGIAVWYRWILGGELIRNSIYYMPFYMLLVSWYQAFYNWFVRIKAYGLISVLLLLYPLGFVGCALICYYYNCTEFVLIKAVLGARLLQVLIMLILFVVNNKRFSRLMSIYGILKTAKRYKDFPRYMVVSGVVDNAAQAAPVYFLQMCFGAEMVGYYSITMQALAAPGALVAKTIGDVFRQRASWLVKHGEDCGKFYDYNVALLGKCAVLLVVGVLLFAPFAYGLVFGSAWRVSGELARLVLPQVACFLIASPLSMMYIITERQRRYLGVQLGGLLLRVIALLFGGMILGDFRQTILLDSVLYALVGVWIIWEGRRFAQMGCLQK